MCHSPRELHASRRPCIGASCFALLVVVDLVAGCAYRTRSESKGPMLSPVDAYEMASTGKLMIVDIRSYGDRTRDGTPKGAVLVAFSSSDTDQFLVVVLRATNNVKAQPIAVLCSRGVYSRTAQAALIDAGFSRVYSVDGGFLGGDNDPGWKTWGLPTEPFGTIENDP